MMADENPRVRGFRSLAQARPRFDRMRDGFLDQRRYARRDAFERLIGVKLIRRREDHAVGPFGLRKKRFQ